MKNLLLSEIEDELQELNKMKVGESDSYSSAVKGISTLIDKKNDLDKIDLENRKLEFESQKFEKDLELKDQELKHKMRSTWITIGVGVATTVASIALTVWGTDKTLKFEETGTVTTNSGKHFVNRLFKH